MNERYRAPIQIRMSIPIVFLAVAATAVPVELRPIAEAKISYLPNDLPDILANVLAFVPLGIIFLRCGKARAVVISALISGLAEISQLSMLHRDPSLVDLAANVAGAYIGVLIGSQVSWLKPTVNIRRAYAVPCAITWLALTLHIGFSSVTGVNDRGLTSPGILEGEWPMVVDHNGIAANVSNHTVASHDRRSSQLWSDPEQSNEKSRIDLGSPADLHFRGSLTITGWINSTSFPYDDAAIVSSLELDSGYQLDTTVDQKIRTVGFKLSDDCGNLMARYGSVPITRAKWYYVAGVYDSTVGELHVYLNGVMSDGVLVGDVSRSQRPSRGHVFIGKRPNSDQYGFIGSLRDLRVYSFALTPTQLTADMNHEVASDTQTRYPNVQFKCSRRSYPEDKNIPAQSALLGILAGITCICMLPKISRVAIAFVSLASGVVVFAVCPPLPSFNIVTIPILAMVGGVSMVYSRRYAVE